MGKDEDYGPDYIITSYRTQDFPKKYADTGLYSMYGDY